MKTKKEKLNSTKNKIYYSLLLIIIINLFLTNKCYAADPKLIATLNTAFEKIEKYILKLSTPAAAIAVSTGLLMKKFSFGDEERIRTGKRLVKGSLFSYSFILCIDLVLSLIQTLLT